MPETDQSFESFKQFQQLFWAARRVHARLRNNAKATDPEQLAALEFGEAQGWNWAADLLEASRKSCGDNWTEAFAAIARLRPTIPEEVSGLLHLIEGSSLRKKGNLDEAIKAYRKALDSPNFDNTGLAWNNLGNALSDNGQLDEAIEAYRKALDSPNHDTPGASWHNLGVALARKGELDQAIQTFRDALNLPNNDYLGKTWNSLGVALQVKGDLDGAIQAFRNASESPEASVKSFARARLRILESELSKDALSPDDRALFDPPLSSSSDDVEFELIGAIQASGETQYDKYLERSDSKRDNTLSILRGWSSAVTLLEGSERKWRGGGYFLKWRGCGIVIDPGFDFLRNFHDAGFHGREINIVAVSHNHPDHNSDRQAIDDLRYELYSRLAKDAPGRKPYLLIWDQDTAQSSSSNIEKPEHVLDPVVLAFGFPHPLDLMNHCSKFPVRIIPFKVNHGNDVPAAMAFAIELLDEDANVNLRIGYTADTEYFDNLSNHLKDCDLLLAHISQPSVEELQDPKKSKTTHLGYRGTIRLLKECKPKLALLGEFWAGFTDLRIPLSKAVRTRSGVDTVLPTGLGMHVHLPSLDIECTECGKPTPYTTVRVAPPADQFGNLAYLCPGCLLD